MANNDDALSPLGVNTPHFNAENVSNFGNQQQLNVMSADQMNVASDYRMNGFSSQHIYRRPATTMDYNTMPTHKNCGNHYPQPPNESEVNAQQSKIKRPFQIYIL